MKVEEAKEENAGLAVISAGRLLVEYKSHQGPSFILMTI